MRVSKLTLRNIMGHEAFELNADGAFTLVEGLNGQGKTSIIEALRSLVGGGHDATLLRNGATEGEIVLLLDDETEIKKRITPDESKVTVRRPDVGQITAGQTFVRRLIDNIDPTEMLAERNEERRTQFLLEALPLTLDPADVAAALEGVAFKPAPADLVGHPLVVIEKIRAAVYDERTGINREAKAAKTSLDELTKSLPQDAAEDPAAEIDRLEANKDAVIAEGDAAIDKIRRDAEAGKRTISDAAGIEARRIAAEIDALRAQHDAVTRKAVEEHVAIDRQAATESEAVRTAAREKLADIRVNISRLNAAADARSAAENTRRICERFRREHETLSAESNALTAAIDRIDDLKAGLLKKVPLKDVAIVDGVIHEKGIPWPRINKGNQVKIAINLAKLRAKALPLVPIDNIECLDGPTFEAFRKNAPKSGLQFIVTRVRQSDDKTPGVTVSGPE